MKGWETNDFFNTNYNKQTERSRWPIDGKFKKIFFIQNFAHVG